MLPHACTQAADAGRHQRDVEQGTHADHGSDVFAAQPLPQHKSVLCTDGDDERCAEREPGDETVEGEGIEHVPSVGPSGHLARWALLMWKQHFF